MDLNIVQGVGAQTGEYGGAAGDLGNLGRAIGIRTGDGEQAVRNLGIQGYSELGLAAGNGNAVHGYQVIIIVEPVGEEANGHQDNQHQGNGQRGLAAAVFLHVHRGDVLHNGLSDRPGGLRGILWRFQKVFHRVQFAVQVEVVLHLGADDGEHHIVLLLGLLRRRRLFNGDTRRGEAHRPLVKHGGIRRIGGAL